jgi:hypothetical protein
MVLDSNKEPVLNRTPNVDVVVAGYKARASAVPEGDVFVSAGDRVEGFSTDSGVAAAGSIDVEGNNTNGGVVKSAGVDEQGMRTHGGIVIAVSIRGQASRPRGGVVDAVGAHCKIASVQADEHIGRRIRVTDAGESVHGWDTAETDDACAGSGCVGQREASVQTQITGYSLIGCEVVRSPNLREGA